MTRDDIIRMAREAGIDWHKHWDDEENRLELFASLVAAAEREACAKVCDDIEEEYQRREGMRYPELRSDAETGSGKCAFAIRARGEK